MVVKATRYNGRLGKHGTYDAKHNDRRFDVENSEHIDAERTKLSVYWDCYQGYSLPNDEKERARHCNRVKSIDSILENNKTCPEETLLQLGNIDGKVSTDMLAKISKEISDKADSDGFMKIPKQLELETPFKQQIDEVTFFVTLSIVRKFGKGEVRMHGEKAVKTKQII